ncbi:hypothetical protein J2Z80_000190 [Thermoanaerobacterium butyriciformans]|uniref:Uncharacterized protein n=1 Tax=Thermoanaerobacterium butyriciformans TaxID=1702242 RepID=A0ABS4NAK1_9THEO|nr:hypothetical protein [Thermoanaerobacterium butyriciformans]
MLMQLKMKENLGGKLNVISQLCAGMLGGLRKG